MVFSQAAYSKLFTSWRISTACKRFNSLAAHHQQKVCPMEYLRVPLWKLYIQMESCGKTETAVLISSRHLEIVLFCLEQGPLTRSLRSLFNHSIQVLFSSVFSVLFFSGLRRHIFLILWCRLLGVKNGDGNVS